MAQKELGRIHPTAIISSDAVLADDVLVGAFAIIEGEVIIGEGTIIHPRAHLIGPMKIGCRNEVFPNAYLGGKPQHLLFKNEPTRVDIGDGNIFRENVTVHRGTTARWTTRIGNNNLFMAGSHIAHDCIVGDRCLMANNALIAGHCELANNAYISANSAIHQFSRMGRLAFLSGVSACTKDIPPFIMQQNINQVVGVNIIGMRRAGLKTEEINAIRKLYHIVYLKGLNLPNSLARVEAELGHLEVVQEYLNFVRASQRGICGVQGPSRYADLDMAA